MKLKKIMRGRYQSEDYRFLIKAEYSASLRISKWVISETLINPISLHGIKVVPSLDKAKEFLSELINKENDKSPRQ